MNRVPCLVEHRVRVEGVQRPLRRADRGYSKTAMPAGDLQLGQPFSWIAVRSRSM